MYLRVFVYNPAIPSGTKQGAKTGQLDRWAKFSRILLPASSLNLKWIDFAARRRLQLSIESNFAVIPALRGVPSKQPVYFVWKTKYKGNSRDRKTNNGGSWTQHGGAGKVDDERGREIGVKRRFIHGRKGGTKEKDVEAEAAALNSQVYHLVEYTFMADFRKEKRRQEPAAYHCICKLSCKGQKNGPGAQTPASSSDSSPDSSAADY